MVFKAEYIVLFDRVQIRYYGIIIVLAMLVAAAVAARLAKRDGRDPDHIWGALTWAIIPAIVLARLWFVIFPPSSVVEQGMDTAWFFAHFFDVQNGAIAIWSGGLSIFGAVIGGFLGAWLYFSQLHNQLGRVLSAIFRLWRVYLLVVGALAIIGGLANQQAWLVVVGIVGIVIAGLAWTRQGRRYLLMLSGQEAQNFPAEGLSIAPWLDIAGVALPLGQAIGRLANYVNQEIYGTVTSLPWGITIDATHRVAPYKSLVDFPVATTRFHPLFLYEMLWNLLAFIVLLYIFQRNRSKLRYGDVFLLYVMQYSFIRFLLEFLRVEISVIPGTSINSSQVFCLIAFIAAFVTFLYRQRNAPTVEEAAKSQPVTKPAKKAA